LPQPLLPSARADRAYDVVCLGLNACDHLCLVPSFPKRGTKTQAVQMVTSGGGQAATAACALAKLGRKVAYVGVRGDDGAGERAESWLRGFGVDPIGLVLKPGSGSQQGFILVEQGSGERTIMWERDAACHLSPQDLDPGLIASARVLHLDGHFMEASLEAARIARRHGVLVSLDGEKILPGTERLVPMCDVVIGCQDYAQRLCGIDDPDRALKELSGLGPIWAGRTMGPQGCEMYAGGDIYRQPAYQVEALDTTGAGDVFHGGMVHAILGGQGPADALRTASALAAISVTGLGGRSALPDLKGLSSFMALHKAGT
jgi:sulfofructose kinase